MRLTQLEVAREEAFDKATLKFGKVFIPEDNHLFMHNFIKNF